MQEWCVCVCVCCHGPATCPCYLPRGRWSLKVPLLQMAQKRLIKIQKPYQPHSPQTLLQLLLRLSLPQDALQPADQLGSKPLRLHVDILWNPVRALRGETSNCKPPDFLSAPPDPCGRFQPPPPPPSGMKYVSVEHRHNPSSRTQSAFLRVSEAPACGRLLPAGSGEHLILLPLPEHFLYRVKKITGREQQGGPEMTGDASLVDVKSGVLLRECVFSQHELRQPVGGGGQLPRSPAAIERGQTAT